MAPVMELPFHRINTSQLLKLVKPKSKQQFSSGYSNSICLCMYNTALLSPAGIHRNPHNPNSVREHILSMKPVDQSVSHISRPLIEESDHLRKTHDNLTICLSTSYFNQILPPVANKARLLFSHQWQTKPDCFPLCSPTSWLSFSPE